MAIFVEKQVLKGPQVDFNVVKVAFQFLKKKPEQNQTFGFWSALHIKVFLDIFLQNLKKHHWVFHVFGENSFSRVFAVVLV